MQNPLLDDLAKLGKRGRKSPEQKASRESISVKPEVRQILEALFGIEKKDSLTNFVQSQAYAELDRLCARAFLKLKSGTPEERAKVADLLRQLREAVTPPARKQAKDRRVALRVPVGPPQNSGLAEALPPSESVLQQAVVSGTPNETLL